MNHIDHSTSDSHSTSESSASDSSTSESGTHTKASAGARNTTQAPAASASPRGSARPDWRELAQSVSLNAQKVAQRATAWLKRSGEKAQQMWRERSAKKGQSAAAHTDDTDQLSAPVRRESRATRDALDRAANEGMLP